MLINKSVAEFIEIAASDSPTLGGGSVAALSGSLGAALTTMVANLSFDKKAYEELDGEIKKEFDDNFKRLNEIKEELTQMVDEDSKAFGGVLEAFKMPKETDEEKKLRSQAIQAGYMVALELPYDCGKLCLEILKLQDVFAKYGNINAITDIGVGTLLAYSGIEGAFLNVEINLKSIKDEDFRRNKYETIKSELEEARKIREETMKIVYQRLA